MQLPRRLDKYLHDRLPLSAAQVRQACRSGRVEVRGDPSPDARNGRQLPIDALVFPDDEVWLDGMRVQPVKQRHDAVLHKPRSVTCTTREPRGKRDLSFWLAQMPEGMFPVGRLDRATTGLLVLTSDGDLANAILHPDHRTEKLYWLWLNEELTQDDPRLRGLLQGVRLQRGLARATSVRIQHRTDHYTELLVTLEDGMNRQIRRMCYALDLRLLHLHRKAVGPLQLGELPVGAWRFLSTPEVTELWQAVGGRKRVAQRQRAALQQRARRARAAGRPEPRLEAWLRGADGGG